MELDREHFKLIYGFSKEYLDETKALWEPYFNKTINYQEAADLANNIIDLEMYLRSIRTLE